MKKIGIALIIINWIGAFFGFHIDLNFFSALITGALGVPGIIILLISIIGEYLGRIFNETKNRPLYFVDEYNGEKERNIYIKNPKFLFSIAEFIIDIVILNALSGIIFFIIKIDLFKVNVGI